MSTKKTNIKKEKKSKFHKKNFGFVLWYLKIWKVVKIFLAIVITLSIFYLFYLVFKNKFVDKFINDFSLNYSKVVYGNIYSNVEINGIKRANIEKINSETYEFCNLDNKNDMEPLLSKLMDDIWIKNVSIKREIPNALYINIEEYLPFALWKNGNVLHLIDENGKIIRVDEREKRAFFNLIVVAGDGSRENIYSLFNLLSSNPSLFSRIKSALRIGERRWNLELDNGIIIKMPEKNELEAWERLNKILSIHGSEIDLKTIDLRNEDKIFLEEK